MFARYKHFGRIAGSVCGIVVIVAFCILGYKVMHGYDQTAAYSTKIHKVVPKKAPTAKDVAKQLGCTRFKDLGPAPAGKVLDAATCYQGHKKLAIDTFANEVDRDLWVANTAGYGVKVSYESSNAVVYPSLSQSDY